MSLNDEAGATFFLLLGSLEEWLADRPDLRRMIAGWLRATLMRRADYRILLPEVNDLQELRLMLADRLEEWAHQYKAEGMQQGIQQGKLQGRQEGRQEGEALALQRLLVRRFGEVSPSVLDKIATASNEQIEAWLDRVLEAPTLDAVFAHPSH